MTRLQASNNTIQLLDAKVMIRHSLERLKNLYKRLEVIKKVSLLIPRFTLRYSYINVFGNTISTLYHLLHSKKFFLVQISETFACCTWKLEYRVIAVRQLSWREIEEYTT